jgi:hypothetical protein
VALALAPPHKRPLDEGGGPEDDSLQARPKFLPFSYNTGTGIVSSHIRLNLEAGAVWQICLVVRDLPLTYERGAGEEVNIVGKTHDVDQRQISLCKNEEIIFMSFNFFLFLQASHNRAVLLEAMQDFSKHWKVAPHVFFVLGKFHTEISVSDPDPHGNRMQEG